MAVNIGYLLLVAGCWLLVNQKTGTKNKQPDLFR
jgi:hypothetical protein